MAAGAADSGRGSTSREGLGRGYGGARQASCPEGLNYCEAGVTELRAFERDGNIASLVDAQDLLLKGIERISDAMIWTAPSSRC